MDIICFGDSLTFGSVGHSYIKYLKKATDCKLVNKGVNGDTTIPLYTRLERHISKAKKQGTYIVCIGINDLLLPYLTSVSTLWKMQISPRVRCKHCISDNALFEMEYRKLINLVTSNNHHLIVIGLPYLELKDFPNDRITERNILIKNLADEYKVKYININEIQDGFFPLNMQEYSWRHKNLIRILEGMILPIVPALNDVLARARHMCCTVDGVHWNSVFAKAVAEKIQNVLLNEIW